jgi:predicted lipoprotein with Yx(FWY)xxD motif
MRKVTLVGGLLALGLLTAACGGGGDSTTATDPSDAPAASSMAPDEGSSGSTATPSAGNATMGGATVDAKKVNLGSILVDGKGMTLYLFEKDKNGKSACDGPCAEAWPPLLTDGDPQAGSSVDASKLGTTKRSDGKTQVTYNNWPVYYYVADKAPGDMTGQNVDSFGAEWYVIGSEKGEKLEK